MDKDVLRRNIDNRYAVPFLIFLVLAGLHWFLLSPLMISPFPDRFGVDHQGQPLVRVGAQWLEASGEGGIDLRPLGIDRYQGMVLPLPSGEWLVNLGGQQLTHRQRLRRFIRLAPGQGGESSLVRCQADLGNCRPWGNNELAMDDDFALVALSQSRFVLADTSRHRVFLLDGEGRELDRMGGVQFPNDLLAHEGAVYVVDTNGGRVLRLQPSSTALGEPETVLRLSGHDAFRGRPMPIRLARSQSDWWLIATNMAMANGRLYRIDMDWQNPSRIDKPELDDLVAVSASDEGLLLAGFRGDHLWQFEPEQALLTALEHSGLSGYLASLDQETSQLKWRTGFQVAVLLALALVFLTIGLLRSTAPLPAPAPIDNLAQRISSGPLWFAYKPEMLRMLEAGAWIALFLFVLMSLLSIMLGASVLMGDGEVEQRSSMLLQTFWLQVFLVVIKVAAGVYLFFELRRMARYRLGRDKELLLLEDPAGDVHRINPAELSYDRFQLLWKGTLVPLSAGLYGPLLEKQDRLEGLMPLLEEHATRRSSFALSLDWLARRPGVFISLFIGIGLYVMVWLLYILYGR
ncbi:MAG: hypothetical protein EA418_01115 [Wenzhouxiangellaceae bacterium]|nr:MAG: hypothetical protein EA418_01115 [Wenzhouxiangellaceae bacterium]